MDCWTPHDGTIASLHNTVLFGVEPLSKHREVSWMVGLLTMAPSRHFTTLFSSVWNLFQSIGKCHGLLGSSRWHHRVIAQHCSLRCGSSLKHRVVSWIVGLLTMAPSRHCTTLFASVWNLFKSIGWCHGLLGSSRWHHRVIAQHCSLRCGSSLKASGGVMDCWAPHEGTIASLHNIVRFGVEAL